MQASQKNPSRKMSPAVRLAANLLSSGALGLLFGCGLIVAGMSNPATVLAFLDLAGSWNPTLALVMLAALTIAAPAFALAQQRRQEHRNSYLGLPLQLPEAPRDASAKRKLIIGSLLFGVGWGLSGICPGPAVVLLGAGVVKAVWFVAAMALGMALFELLQYRQQRLAGAAAHHANNVAEKSQ